MKKQLSRRKLKPDSNSGPITVRILRAHGLRVEGKDESKISAWATVTDASLTKSGRHFSTKKDKRTANPTWGESFTLIVNDLTDFALELVVWDKAGLSSHEVGRVRVTSKDCDLLSSEPKDFNLSFPEGNGSINFQVVVPDPSVAKVKALGVDPASGAATSEPESPLIKVPVAPAPALASVVPTPVAASPVTPPAEEYPTASKADSLVIMKDANNEAGVMKLRIIEAKDLADGKNTVSPFAMVEEYRQEGNKVIRTKAVKKTCNPDWSEHFEFDVVPFQNWTVVISLWDENILRSERLGTVTLHGGHDTKNDFWVNVEGGTGRVRFDYKVVRKSDVLSVRAKQVASPFAMALNPMRKVLGRVTGASDAHGIHQEGLVICRVIKGEGFLAGKSLRVRFGLAGQDGQVLETKSIEGSIPVPEWNEVHAFKVERVDQWSCLIGIYDGDQEVSHVIITGDTAARAETWYPMDKGVGRLLLAYDVKMLNIDPNRRTSLASVLAQNQEQRGPGRVSFLIFEGESLAVRDEKSGTCDAFVEIIGVSGGELMKKKNKTRVIHKSVYPRWDEEFSIRVDDVENWSVACSVWHKAFSGNKSQGHFEVVGTSKSVPTQKMHLVEGKGWVSIGYTVISDQARALEETNISFVSSKQKLLSPREGENPGFVRLFLYSAENLMAKDASGTSDPFAVIEGVVDVDGKECKTKVIKKTLNPKWDESFVFQVPNMDRWAVRVRLWDWDLIGNDKLGFLNVIGSAKSQERIMMNVMEGSGSVSLGWVVSKALPDEPEEQSDLRVAMPNERQGRLRIHVKSAEQLQRQCSTFVRLVDGATGHDQTKMVEGSAGPTWNEWLEVDVPDLARWTVQLNLVEYISESSEKVLGSATLTADKFDLGGSTDYKTFPLADQQGDLVVGVAPDDSCKKLAVQVARAKAALQAQEIRRARIRTKTLMNRIGKEGINAGEFVCKIREVTGEAGMHVYLTMEGISTVDRSEIKTENYVVGSGPWDHVITLHVPDAANFAFDVLLWREERGLLGMKKHSLVGRGNVSSLDMDLRNPVQREVKISETQSVRFEFSATPHLVEVLTRLQEGIDSMAAAPLHWPEHREGIVRLHAIKANDLKAADFGGTSDPYVQIQGAFDMHGKPVKSEIVKKTLSPVWNQWFDIPVPDLADFDFSLGLWDYDVGKDDTLGYVQIRSGEWEFSEKEQVRTLTVINGAGTIDVGLAPSLHSQAILRRIKAARKAGLAPVLSGAKDRLVKSKNSGVLRLTLVAAAGLAAADRGGTSDPYAMVSRSFFTDTKGKEIRTQVQKKTLAPAWNEAFEFYCADIRDFKFQITLWDWDLGRHDSLGYVMIRSLEWIEFYETGKEERWLRVEDAEGQLCVRLEATDAALRVLRRLAEEKREQMQREQEAEAKRLREERVRRLCAERLKAIRELVPLYERKGFDPMVLFFVVLVLLFLAHIVLQVWLHLDDITATAMAVWVPTRDWGIWSWSKAVQFFFATKDFFITQYGLLTGATSSATPPT